MDLTTPIDIQAVIGACKKHRNLLKTVDAEDAFDILRHFTAIPDVKDSITLGKTTLGKVSRKYTGRFIGQVSNGKVIPRTLVVRPVVMEMDDEPERYRRTYIQEVKGGLYPKEHPFEIWLNNFGIKCASKELHDEMLTAKYDADDSKTDLKDSFDGILTIVETEKTAGEISAEKGNLYATGVMTVADVGDKLLEMWRHMPEFFKKRGGKMFISYNLGELYDDWLDNQGTLITGSGAETSGQKFLRNSEGKCELVRLTGMPLGTQFVMITTRENICWGYDKEIDFRRMIPTTNGAPYHYTAAGKYVIGFQFVTLHQSEFCINDQPVTPVAAEEDAGDEQVGS